MTDSEFVFVYSTFPDEDSARRVADALVSSHLAACVNIHGPMSSVYIWKDQLERSREFALFIKTRRLMANQVIDAARKLHPYTLPCFLVLPIEGGNADYLGWARAQTERPQMA